MSSLFDSTANFIVLRAAEPQGILVTFDIGAFADTTEKSVKEVLQKALESGQVGKYAVDRSHFSFRTVAGLYYRIWNYLNEVKWEIRVWDNLNEWTATS